MLLIFCRCCIINNVQYYTVTKTHFSYYITVTTTRDLCTYNAHHGASSSASSSAVNDSTTLSNPFFSTTFLFFRDEFSIGLGILARPLGLPRLFGAAYCHCELKKWTQLAKVSLPNNIAMATGKVLLLAPMP